MRSRAALLTATITLTLLVAGAGTAYARDNNPGISFGDDCYSLTSPTCHTVFSRSYTHNVLAPASPGAAAGLLASVIATCRAAWGQGGQNACAAIFGVYAGASQAAISQAAAQNQCAGYTTYFTDAIAIWRTDNGPLCKP